MDGFEAVNEIAKACDGTIKEVGILPDGSGFATMSMALPENHWIYGKELNGEYEAPPMFFKMGAEEIAYMGSSRNGRSAMIPATMTKQEFAEKIREAGKYAVRSSTMNGKEMDFDPDALLQNLVVAFLGYWTDDGLSGDDWANPPRYRKPAVKE